MRLRPGLVLLGLIAFLPNAQAKGPDCDLIKAIGRPGAASLAGIRTEVGGKGTATVSYRGKMTSIAGATSCELSGPEDIFRLGCTWDTRGDLAAAQAIHRQLKSDLEQCLPGGLVPQNRTSSVEGLEVLGTVEGRLENRDGDAMLEVQLEIHHYADIDGSYAVILSIQR